LIFLVERTTPVAAGLCRQRLADPAANNPSLPLTGIGAACRVTGRGRRTKKEK
jgi:hypothetical protein